VRISEQWLEVGEWSPLISNSDRRMDRYFNESHVAVVDPDDDSKDDVSSRIVLLGGRGTSTAG